MGRPEHWQGRAARKGRRGDRTLLLGALALAGCALAAPALSHAALKRTVIARPLITIQARIRVYTSPGIPITSMMAPRAVTFSPDTVNVGTVILSIRNTDDESHTLQIAGKTSPLIGPGGRAFMHVTFRHVGVYPVSVSTEDPVPIGGSVRVVK